RLPHPPAGARRRPRVALPVVGPLPGPEAVRAPSRRRGRPDRDPAPGSREPARGAPPAVRGRDGARRGEGGGGARGGGLVTSRRARFGTAGWSYPDWKGTVYPRRAVEGFDPLRYLSA